MRRICRLLLRIPIVRNVAAAVLLMYYIADPRTLEEIANAGRVIRTVFDAITSSGDDVTCPRCRTMHPYELMVCPRCSSALLPRSGPGEP